MASAPEAAPDVAFAPGMARIDLPVEDRMAKRKTTRFTAQPLETPRDAPSTKPPDRKFSKPKRRLTLANAAAILEEMADSKNVKKAKRHGKLMGRLAKLTVVKSGGIQLLVHLIMFISIILLVVLSYTHAPRSATLHSTALLTNKIRSVFVASERDGSFAALRSLVDLIEHTREQPGEYSFTVVSPLLLRHVARTDEGYGQLPEACRQIRGMRHHLETTAFDGIQQRYSPTEGELIELGELNATDTTVSGNEIVEDPTLGVFNATEAHLTLSRMSEHGWLTPKRSKALFVDFVLMYADDVYVASRLLIEVDGIAGLHSLTIRAWSLIPPQPGTYASVIACLLLLALSTLAQVRYEIVEFRHIGRKRYMKDFWNYVEAFLILLNLLLLLATAFFGISRITAIAGYSNMASACLPKLPAVAEHCPHLSADASLSLCRTQLWWGASELLHDCSVLLATLLMLAGVHSIKYMELVPRLALPIHALTATALDLLALFVVVAMLLVCFAVMMMMVLGPSSSNFANFEDAILSSLLLSLGNIEFLDLLWREGPNQIYEQSAKPAFYLFIAYHWMIVVILLSLVIAALTSGYEKARERVKENFRKVNDSFRLVWQRRSVDESFVGGAEDQQALGAGIQALRDLQGQMLSTLMPGSKASIAQAQAQLEKQLEASTSELSQKHEDISHKLDELVDQMI